MDETEAAEDAQQPAPSPSRAGAREPKLADRIGRYLILRKLGAGGMGVVYAAYDEQLDRKLAIKLLRQGSRAATQATRLLREAQGLARLSHSNVVTIYEVGQHQGMVFMAMEFVAGQTLGDWLEAQPRTQAEILAAFMAAGRGLAAAHAARLIHRDFKPDNVMIGEHGEVKVMDFGLVRAEGEAPADDDAQLDDAGETDEGPDVDPLQRTVSGSVSGSMSSSVSSLSQHLTRTGAVMGTPAYMAPEQHLGAATDARSDQFSFCVALWEALCRQRPFAGDSVAALAFNVAQGRLQEPPREAKLPAWLRRVLERGLAREPADRWPSMDALLGALSRDPSHRRWVLGAGLALVTVVASAMGWMQLDGQRRAEAAERRHGEALAACEQQARARSEALWTSSRRAAIEQAFGRSQLSYAADSLQRILPALDDYAGGLARQRSQLCVDAEVEGRVAIETAELAARCLDEHEIELEVLLDTLATADDTRVERAVSSVAGLPSPEQCRDERLLARRPSLPDDEQLRGRVFARRAELARARALLGIGEAERARELVDAVLAAPELEASPALRAKAVLMDADLHDETGDYAAARDGFEQAMYLAAKAGDDLLVLDAARELVHTLGYDLAEPDAGLRVAKLAEILVERTGSSGTLDDAALHINLGSLLAAKGQHEQALAAYAEALAMQEALLPVGHPTLAIVLNNMGTAHGALGDLDGALAYFERSLAIREAALPATHPRLAAAHLNIGVVRTHKGDQAGAREQLERALAINRANLPADHPDIALVIENLGVLAYEEGDYERARDDLEQALAMRLASLGPDHRDVANAHANLGDTLLALEQFDAAAEHLRRSLELREAQGAPATKLANLMIAIGEAERRRGRAREAVEVLQRATALELAEDPLDLALAQWELALALADLGREAEAIDSMRACYLSYAEHGQPSDLVEIVEWLAARGLEPPARSNG